jgi:hypothetical protein
MRLTFVILFFAATGCGGSGEEAAGPADPASPEGAFERFQAAMNSGDGKALLDCVLAEDQDNTVAGYGAVVAAFAGTGAALPILKRHGASMDEGWGSKGKMVAKVVDKGALPVRCTFDLKRCGAMWCLAGPKFIWELLK